jgi:spermidine/putrescine transport system substrate-binding protein
MSSQTNRLVLALVVSLCLILHNAWASEADTAELVLLNWSEYMDPEVLEAFESSFDVRVKQVYFDSDAGRDEILVETDGGRGYDLVMVDGSTIAAMAKRGWLEPVESRLLPNLTHIDPRWRSALPEAEGYGVPYFWGTVGIGYRQDLVTEPMTSWLDLFQPQEPLHGKIAMIRDPKDLISMALKASGHSINSTDREALAQAEALLLQQKPFVKFYQYISLSKDSALVTGEIAAAMMYSGDALMVQEHNPNIVYVLPKEGSNLWVDYLTVLSASQNKELAWRFINFLNRPKVAARLAEYVHYATPNRAAEAFLPAEFFTDPIIYPSEQALARSEFYTSMPARGIRRRNAVFALVVQ